MVRVLISTGEVSGDLQGSLLVQALHRQASVRGIPLEVLALGGPRMQAAGAELLADTAPLGSIGLLEHLPQVLPTLKLQSRVNRELLQRPPDAVVLIDYMGANVRLGKRLRRQLPQGAHHLLHRSPGMGLEHERWRHHQPAEVHRSHPGDLPG